MSSIWQVLKHIFPGTQIQKCSCQCSSQNVLYEALWGTEIMCSLNWHHIYTYAFRDFYVKQGHKRKISFPVSKFNESLMYQESGKKNIPQIKQLHVLDLFFSIMSLPVNLHHIKWVLHVMNCSFCKIFKKWIPWHLFFFLCP